MLFQAKVAIFDSSPIGVIRMKSILFPRSLQIIGTITMAFESLALVDSDLLI